MSALNKEQDVFLNNVSMFVDAFIERNWDAMSEQPYDVARAVMEKVLEAAHYAAADEPEVNPEMMYQMGQDFDEVNYLF